MYYYDPNDRTPRKWATVAAACYALLLVVAFALVSFDFRRIEEKPGDTIVIDFTEQFYRSPGRTLVGTRPRHTESDIVNSTGLKRERTGRLHETTVLNRVWTTIVTRLFAPIETILVESAIRLDTTCSPVTWVRIKREHKVAFRPHCTGFTRNSSTTILHAFSILPDTLKEQIILSSFIRVTIYWITCIIMINKTSHTKTFVIYNTVTEINTIDTLVAQLISIRIIFGIVYSIRIQIRSLEEVNTHSRRIGTVSLCLTITIDINTIVTIAKTT